MILQAVKIACSAFSSTRKDLSKTLLDKVKADKKLLVASNMELTDTDQSTRVLAISGLPVICAMTGGLRAVSNHAEFHAPESEGFPASGAKGGTSGAV